MDVWEFKADDSAAFMEWLEAHQEGWFLNMEAGEFGMIHRGWCSHFKGDSEELRRGHKVCTDTEHMLGRWIADHLNGSPEVCTDCPRPPKEDY